MAINDMIVSDYRDKGTDFSSTDFTIPNYQLWVKKNFPRNLDDKQSQQAWVGQLIHDASYRFPETNVIKEFSGLRNLCGKSIGGSIDRMEYADSEWHIADIKSQGMFPAQSSFKEPKKEWITQLSIYKWIAESYGLQVSSTGIIHQYVLGFTMNKIGMNEYNKILIPLLNTRDIELMIESKIDIANGNEPVSVDCEGWRCESYCSWNKSCPHYNRS